MPSPSSTIRRTPGGSSSDNASGLGASGNLAQFGLRVPTSMLATVRPGPAAARHSSASKRYSVTTTIEEPDLRVAMRATDGIFVSHPAIASARRSLGLGAFLVTGSGNGSGSRPCTCTAAHVRPLALALVVPEVGNPALRRALLAWPSGTSTVKPSP